LAPTTVLVALLAGPFVPATLWPSRASWAGQRNNMQRRPPAGKGSGWSTTATISVFFLLFLFLMFYSSPWPCPFLLPTIDKLRTGQIVQFLLFLSLHLGDTLGEDHLPDFVPTVFIDRPRQHLLAAVFFVLFRLFHLLALP